MLNKLRKKLYKTERSPYNLWPHHHSSQQSYLAQHHYIHHTSYLSKPCFLPSFLPHLNFVIPYKRHLLLSNSQPSLPQPKTRERSSLNVPFIKLCCQPKSVPWQQINNSSASFPNRIEEASARFRSSLAIWYGILWQLNGLEADT